MIVSVSGTRPGNAGPMSRLGTRPGNAGPLVVDVFDLVSVFVGAFAFWLHLASARVLSRPLGSVFE